MYLMYADESGDIGTQNSPTNYFVPSALIFHEPRWNAIMESRVAFRRPLCGSKGLKMREEIHATHFINRLGS